MTIEEIAAILGMEKCEANEEGYLYYSSNMALAKHDDGYWLSAFSGYAGESAMGETPDELFKEIKGLGLLLD